MSPIHRLVSLSSLNRNSDCSPKTSSAILVGDCEPSDLHASPKAAQTIDRSKEDLLPARLARPQPDHISHNLAPSDRSWTSDHTNQCRLRRSLGCCTTTIAPLLPLLNNPPPRSAPPGFLLHCVAASSVLSAVPDLPSIRPDVFDCSLALHSSLLGSPRSRT